MFDYSALTAVLSAGLTLAAGYITAAQANQKKAIVRAHERLDQLPAGAPAPPSTSATRADVEAALLAELRTIVTPAVMSAAESAVLHRQLAATTTSTT
jgi:hypothetical protein